MLNIAIDGPVASGKGTVAKAVAKKLNLKYLDTGSLYRACALFLDNKNIKPEQVTNQHLTQIHLDFNEQNQIILNNKNIENEIRTPHTSSIVFLYAKQKIVRDYVTLIAQKIVKNKGFIVDGRDAGSVIEPNAEVKIYMTAPVATRAQRRLEDYKKQGKNLTLEQITDQIRTRDYDDMHRKVGPLIKLPDAHLIDNSNLSVDRQVQIIENLANKAISAQKKHI